MRPPADVVVPFHGSAQAIEGLAEHLCGLALGPDDTITLVDNTRDGVSLGVTPPERVRVVLAPSRQSSYHARNRGAAAGRAPWIVFIDADVEAAPDLLDRYLAPEPISQTGVLVGQVRDLGDDDYRESLAGRYARLRRLIDQTDTMAAVRPYAKTANCAVRRTAFEQVGGFADDIRSGGDADLCFRLQDAGWALEYRPAAAVDHRARRRLSGLLGQRARHGSGAEWLEARYPGFVGPRRPPLLLVRSLCGGLLRGTLALARGDRDQALVRVLDPLVNGAFDVGRRVPNSTWHEQPLVTRLSRRGDTGASRG